MRNLQPESSIVNLSPSILFRAKAFLSLNLKSSRTPAQPQENRVGFHCMNISFWKTTVKPPNKKTSQRVNLNVRLISRRVIFRAKYKTAYNPIKIAVAVYISLSKKYDAILMPFFVLRKERTSNFDLHFEIIHL